jgi:hypothetical protein
MPNDADTVFESFKLGKGHAQSSEGQWREVEKLLKAPPSAESKKQIDFANTGYALVALLHTKEQSTAVSAVESELKSWMKASRRMRLKCGVKTSARNEAGHE